MALHLLSPILACLGIQARPRHQIHTANLPSIPTHEPKYSDKDNNEADTEIATTNFVDALVKAPSSSLYNYTLQQSLADSIKTYNWTESLARSILAKLELLLSDPSKFGGALKDACERVAREAWEFARDHPAYCTLIALGILVVIGMPWILEVLGFAELGPVEGAFVMISWTSWTEADFIAGSFASIWQTRYAGYVPKGSLFSYLQRLGMVWKH